jgi:biotin carboxyl carrier protein
MPGLVREVFVAVGDKVVSGDVLAVIEAMKMELSLQAPVDGVVTEAAAAAGEQVKLGQQLFFVAVPEEDA